MLLLSGAGAILLANAVIGDGREERSRNRWLQYAALALVLCVLPLAVLAGMSMGERISQYGWTPQRIWGVVAVGIAIAYGLVAWWAVYKGRKEFDGRLRPLQTGLAIGLCGLALLLALPILDFGAISARSQLARLESGEIKAEEFDWTAMAFEFGPEGRERLEQIGKTGPMVQRTLAKAALASESRYSLSEEAQSVAQRSRLDRYLRVLSPDIAVTDELKAEITGYDGCNDKPCAVLRLDAGRLLLVYKPYDAGLVQSRVIDLDALGKQKKGPRSVTASTPDKTDLTRASVEVRTVERRQLYVDGKPVGSALE